MAKSAIVAQQQLNAGSDKAQFNKNKLATVRFYIEHVLPRTEAYYRALKNGQASTMAIDADAF